MGEHRRKADGRRVFGAEFKRTTVQRILTGEKTVAELSRELDIGPSVIRNWARRSEAGATTAVAANEDVVPASQLREAYARIRELERLVGKKQMEIEILEAAREIVKKVPGCVKGPGADWAADDGGLPHAGDGPADGLLRRPGPPDRPLSAGRRCGGPAADPGGDEQPGHLWLPPGVGDGEPDLPHWRIRRVMQLHGLMLPPRVHRRHGRPHLGQVQQPASNQRWCSDVFLIPCWSGEVLSVAFAIGRRGAPPHGPWLFRRAREAPIEVPDKVGQEGVRGRPAFNPLHAQL